MNLSKKLDRLYQIRFSSKEQTIKNDLWRVLCQNFFQKFVAKDATVLDLAAGYCEFINNISCKNKIAVDINPEIKKYAKKDVQIVMASADHLPEKLKDKIDVVFAGCFLEHLPSKEAILETFLQVFKVLKPKGKFIILNPNIRFSTSDYWDYFDHLIPVSDRSVVEGLKLTGFEIEKVIPKFVPNTTKDSLPKNLLLLKIYLKIPLLFRIFGRQMFIIARKPG